MKRIFILSLLLIVLIPCLNAQKKEIAQARTLVKSGKNLGQAEKQMLRLLKDSANLHNEKVHLVLCEALRKQYEEGNMKMYLKQKTDTADLFQVARRMFVAYERLDSLDSTPDEKGRVKLKYRAKNSMFLNGYRKNLFNGGSFFLRKQQYQTAFDFFDLYLNTAIQPLFSDYHYPEDPSAASLAMYCGHKLMNSSMVLKYKDMALNDTLRLESNLQYLAETFKSLKDTVNYEHVLTRGFYSFSHSTYFFTYLVDFYNKVKRRDLALEVINYALEKDGNNELFLFAKGNLLLNMERYDECISVCDSIIAQNDTMADAYYTAGVAYVNMAFVLEKKVTNGNSKAKKEMIEMYKKSLPYMEKFRSLCPDEKDKWGAALYNIYFNLNMGKKFEEIDRLLR